MRRSIAYAVFTVVVSVAACSSNAENEGTSSTTNAGGADAANSADSASSPGNDAAAATTADADVDAGISCEWGGAPGVCIDTSDCAAIADHTAYAGRCPGPVNIQCCITTPNVADNPPIPPGYKLMAQVDVTAEMTAWAKVILDDPVTYPMFSTTTKTFGAITVLARVEWHPPDFQNGVIHRGVTLYEPS